ncbi:MAG TPA: GvpL/GvpF family gas vesicle protein [Ktedonobacteraceae bacterium]|nr:GvpL/GvpF family gas vesicle protein [Ktedonobacteraceae bacterium]
MSSGEGYYIYAIIVADHKQEFGPIGIGGRGDVVYTLPAQHVAAVISRSPIVKYQVTRENMLTHASVLEAVAKAYTVLPVRFSTIAANEENIIEKVLKVRHQEFIDLARAMEGKLEQGVRTRWIDMDAIFAELVEENKDIKTLKAASLREKNEQKRHADHIKIGQLVQAALEKKKKREAKELLEVLKPLSLKYKEMQLYGDMNIINAAFLVDRENEPSFDQKINELEQMYAKRKQIKYTTTPVPYNFVELVINV